jgi:hypothetical protein
MTTLKFSGTVSIETDQPPKAGVWITTGSSGITIKAKGPTMAYTLPTDKKVDVKVSYQDAKGNAATVDGAVTWDTSDTAICGVAPRGDSTEATLTPGTVGNAQISATADADLGEGVTTIVCTMDVTVVAGQAVVGTIQPVQVQPVK